MMIWKKLRKGQIKLGQLRFMWKMQRKEFVGDYVFKDFKGK